MILSGLLALLSNVLFFSGYVNSKNAFPKPLDPQKEKELLEQMYAGNKDAREELAKHNMRLVVHVAKKYSNYHDNDELISVGSIGLVKAINTYSPEKGTQFATYAAKCIENEILMTWRAENGGVYHGKKPFGSREWDCMQGGENYAAGFPHLYYHSNPRFVERFLQKCRDTKERR